MRQNQPSEPPLPASPRTAGEPARLAVPCPSYSSNTLFGTAREIHIQHASQVYRLRLTALDKLILTK